MNVIKPLNLRASLRPRLLGALAAPLAAAIMMALPSTSFAQIVVSVDIAPPPIPVYEQPPLPGEGYIWTPGYWAYDQDDYYWVPGTWVRPPTVGYLWTPGYWGWDGNRYAFRSGYWGPHVGFYGGINYGYGYGGRGYEGGYWNHGAFYYNRNVNSFGAYRVRNVYERPVVNITINRISFNGGAGGIELRATNDEQRWDHERHVERTDEQKRQREMASQNKELRAKVNHGAPAIAATPKAGVFQGPGVVRAHEASAEDRAAAAARESKTNANANASKANDANAKSNADASKANDGNAKANADAAKTAREDARVKADASKTNGADAKANADAAKAAREDARMKADASKTNGADANANADAAKTAREDARTKADAARTQRQDARVKSEAAKTDRNGAMRNPDAARAEKPRSNADANGMQQDNPRPNQRLNAQNPERADRQPQGARPANQKVRPEQARKAPPASNENDKKKEDEQKQH